jgi:hypothetical protein
MTSRRPRRWGALTLTLTALLAAGTAGACDIWRDDSGIYRGLCDLGIDFKDKYRVNFEFVAQLKPRSLNQPNLHPRRFYYFLSDDQLTVDVEIENLGNYVAPASEVAMELTILNSRTGLQHSTMAFTVYTMSLQPGSAQRVASTVTLPDTTHDWDIVPWAMVDPPTTALPFGAVWESNESDNTFSEMCRIFGEVSDPKEPPLAGC